MNLKKYILSIIIIILQSGNFYGQDFWQKTSIPNEIITAMFQDENEYIYAVARYRGIYRSVDNGENWSLFTVGITNYEMNCINGDLNGTLYLGTNWTYPASIGLFKSTNRGQTWSQITSFPYKEVRSILPIPGTQTIYVGTGDTLYRSIDNGKNWKALVNGIPANSIIQDIALLSNGDLLASISNFTYGSGIYRSTDNGTSWSLTENGGSVHIRVDKCNNNIYLVWYGPGISKSTDNGYSWQQINNIYSNANYDIAINSLGHIYISTQGGMYPSVCKSTDYGKSWVDISSGLSNLQLYCLLITTNGYILGGTGGTPGNGNGIFCSVNPTFTIPSVITDNPSNVKQTFATLKGTLNPQGLSTSYFFEYGLNTSYGNSTSIQSGGSGNNNISVSSLINNLQQNKVYYYRLVVQLCNGIKIYGNDVQFSTLPPPSISLTIPNGGENWVIGSQQNITWQSAGIDSVKIEYTLDNSIYWLTVTSSTPASVGSYLWTIPNTPSTKCRIMVSDVSNSSMSDTSANIFTISEAPSIIVITPATNTTWIVGGQYTVTWSSVNVLGNVNIKLSTDGGLSFPKTLTSDTQNDSSEAITAQKDTSTKCMIQVESFGNPSIYGRSGLFIIKDTTTTEVRDLFNVQPTKFALYQNFPNPFNPVSRIYYSVPKESHVSIKLYNTLGQEIRTLVNETKPVGNYWINIDGSQLESGVYIYQMKAGIFNQTKKLLLLK